MYNLLQCVLHDMFSIIQYNMLYELEMNKTFMSICITKNTILLKPKYLNWQSIRQNKIYCMHRMHEDVLTKKILPSINSSYKTKELY